VVGAVIGSYQLVRKLGQGGMGAVYLAQHTLLGRRAAIKVLLPALSARPDIVNRFFNEARAVTSISDPGIVQVFDFGYHSDGSAYIVMEYLDGEPLDRRLARLGRLPVHEVLRICRQLAGSLAAAHGQGIVHRDLKPENIFLVPDAEVASGERCKILDFGIAKLSDDHPGKLKTSTGMLMGTPTYMSPEQCRGLAEVDHRSDIYSLGCVLFHLLTGHPPFEGEAPGDIISLHIRERAAPPSSRAPEISPGVDALVLRCLAKSTRDRYQTMAELAAEVGVLLSRSPAGDRETPAPAYHLLPTAKVPVGAAPAIPVALDAGADRPSPGIPTTLGASTGQLASMASRRRVRLWLAGGLVIVAAGIAITVVTMRDAEAPRVTSRSTAPIVIEHRSTDGNGGSGVPGVAAMPAGEPRDRPPLGSQAVVVTVVDAGAPDLDDRREPSKAEPPKAEPPKAEPSKAEPPKAEPPKAEPPKAEPSKAEPSKAEPSKAEPPKAEPSKAELSKPEPSKAAPAQTKTATASSAATRPGAESRPVNETRTKPVTGAKAGRGTKQAKQSSAASHDDTRNPEGKPATESRHETEASQAGSRPGADAKTRTREAEPRPAATNPASERAPASLAGKCARTAFAVIYNAAAPSKAAINAALDTLEECHKAALITDGDYRETKDALVAKLIERP
jgi:hypothetical protein